MSLNIGLLVIATNKYIKFTFPLWESAKKHFLRNHQVTMFVFTNMPEVPAETVRIEQAHMEWPKTTLLRHHVFLNNRSAIEGMDYLFYSDADMLCVDTIGDEVLGDLVGTLHPGFYNKSRAEFSYETRPESTAYIPPNEGTSYFAGGFYGGKKDAYLRMAETVRNNIDTDTQKGITAVWHDESHWNKYLTKNPPTVILSPSYCYQESANLPFTKRLLALDKNHAEMRS
jgi:histo-blood group ABO system transferase